MTIPNRTPDTRESWKSPCICIAAVVALLVSCSRSAPEAETPSEQPKSVAAAPAKPEPAPPAQPEKAAKPQPAEPAPKVDVTAILEKLPTDNAEEAEAVSKELVNAGPEGVCKLADMLLEPGTGDDVNVRLALHGLAFYVSRPGAEAQRKEFMNAMAAQLDKDRPTLVKDFIIDQLQLAGGKEVVPALARHLTNPDLCEAVTQAMLEIPGDAPVEALRGALAKAEGKSRGTIIKALGTRRDSKSAQAILKEAGNEDGDVRAVVFFALANIGDPSAIGALLKAVQNETGYMHTQATASALLLGQRLEEAGKKQDAVRLYRRLGEACDQVDEAHVRNAALRGLVSVQGKEAMGDLIAAMGSDDAQTRSVATDIAASMKGPGLTALWVDKLKGAPPLVKARILASLALRGDRAAIPTLIAALKDKDEVVRLAAIEALGSFSGAEGVAELADMMDGSAAEQKAAERALEAKPGNEASAAIAGQIREAPPKARSALLKVLTRRGAAEQLDLIAAVAASDPEESVRIAALDALSILAGGESLPKTLDLLLKAKTGGERKVAETTVVSTAGRISDPKQRTAPILAALPGQTAEVRCSLLRVLGRLGGAEALEAVRAGVGDANPELKDAAIRVLADWRDAAPAADLLKLAKEAPEQIHRVLCLRGYLRMVGMQGSRPASERLEMYLKAMKVAELDDDRKRVLSGIAEVPDASALETVEKYLGHEMLGEEAAIAMTKIARAISGRNTDLALAAIDKVLKATKEDKVKAQAEEVKKLIDEYGDYVTDWQASGPYQQAGKGLTELHTIAFAPEKEGGKDAKWKRQPVDSDLSKAWRIDLKASLVRDNSAGYLRTKVWSPADQDVLVEVGSDDGVKVWLNGKVIHEINEPRGLSQNQDKVETHLRQGWNDLMLKVTQGGGGWEACVRFRKRDGGRLEGIRAKADQE